MKLDKRALASLMKVNPFGGDNLPPDEEAFARGAGYILNPIALTHDQVVDRLLHARRLVNHEQVANAFVASLSTRRLDLRSALGSFACAFNFPDHRIASSPKEVCPSTNVYCKTCGIYEEGSPGALPPYDLTQFNFERFKWGGANHSDPLFAAFDLERFASTDPIEPTKDDYKIMKEILGTARAALPRTGPTDLSKAIAKLLPSNNNERRTIIDILGYCGVLMPSGRPGYLQEFPTAEHVNQDRPPDLRNDWQYPVIWWRGADGVNEQMLARCFPRLRNH